MHRVRSPGTCTREIRASRQTLAVQVTQYGALNARQLASARRTIVRIRVGQSESENADTLTQLAITLRGMGPGFPIQGRADAVRMLEAEKRTRTNSSELLRMTCRYPLRRRQNGVFKQGTFSG